MLLRYLLMVVTVPVFASVVIVVLAFFAFSLIDPGPDFGGLVLFLSVVGISLVITALTYGVIGFRSAIEHRLRHAVLFFIISLLVSFVVTMANRSFLIDLVEGLLGF